MSDKKPLFFLERVEHFFSFIILRPIVNEVFLQLAREESIKKYFLMFFCGEGVD